MKLLRLYKGTAPSSVVTRSRYKQDQVQDLSLTEGKYPNIRSVITLKVIILCTWIVIKGIAVLLDLY